MASLPNKIREYAKANGVAEVDFLEDVMLQDDSNGKGAYIKEWNLSIAKPTLEQLNTYEAQATTYENNQKIIATRKALYGPWDKQLEEIYDNGIDSWKARIAQIKLDNPKE
jgi:2',3'-cyclic-nucleotide 2'-phosphodiesterase (5'-nucleotidase family)